MQLSWGKKSSYDNHMYNVAVKSMTERQEPGVRSALMFSLKLVAFISG